MTDPTAVIQQAQELISERQPLAARRLLQELLRSQPANEAAWWCYIQTFDRRQDRAAILESFAREFPDHPRLQHLSARLRQPDRSAYVSASRVVPAVKPGQKKPANTSLHRVLIFLPWAILAIVLICLVGSGALAYRAYADLDQRFNILIHQYLILDQSFDDLSLKYKAMIDEFDRLNHEYASLTQDYRSLEGEYEALTADYASLEGEYNLLTDAYLNLESDYFTLADSYQELDSQAIKPPYIYTHQRNIVMAVYQGNGELFYWSFPFSDLEDAIKVGDATRAQPELLNLVTNDGSRYTAEDFRVYVQPESFRDYITNLYYASESDDAFIRQVWGIVTQLTLWTEEFGNIPRFPLESLLAGGGDCEDLSILFASMLKAAPVDWEVDLVYMDTYNLYDPGVPNHVIVFVDTGEQTYHIETTSNEDMTPYTEGVTGWYFPIW